MNTSCWVSEHAVRVPSYHNTGGKIFFAIELTRRASSPTVASNERLSLLRGSFQSSVSGSDRHFTTYRSYSQFRELWKALAGHNGNSRSESQRKNSSSHTLDRLRSRVSTAVNEANTSGYCHCDGASCHFQSIRQVMRVFPFPSRHVRCQKIHLTPGKAALNSRREGLERFIREVHGFFASFQDAIVREKLQNVSCASLGAFARFLQAEVHFPLSMSGALRQPLVLQGWRQQCAEKMMIEDGDESDDSVSNEQLLSEGRATLALAKAEPAVDMRASLPSLQVKSVKVETMYTFMEEFCDHVLSQYAHDITELASPTLTTARRWEICLYVACRIGHTYAVQLILFNYADADASMADGSTCLHIAARMGHTDIVELLLDEGASVNKANDAGVTPMIAACRNGCVDVAKKLLTAGASIAACSARGTYPLHAAIVSQNVEIVQLLVENGADVNVMTASGITPLHFAAKLGSLEISEFLLEHHADVAQRTKNDSDALMIASANGHATICALLQRFAPVHYSSGIGDGRSRRSSTATSDKAGRSSSCSRARQSSKVGEMVRLHSQRLTTRQCAA
ncbi:hypothetical protein Gpo141_00001835 [Globisporangium polare]